MKTVDGDSSGRSQNQKTFVRRGEEGKWIQRKPRRPRMKEERDHVHTEIQEDYGFDELVGADEKPRPRIVLPP